MGAAQPSFVPKSAVATPSGPRTGDTASIRYFIAAAAQTGSGTQRIPAGEEIGMLEVGVERFG